MRGDEEELAGLMSAYQAGRLEAFETLYARLAPDLGGYFGRATRDAAVVADLVQDTFMEIHRSRRTYLPPLPVRPWAFGIARHVLHRHWRARARLREEPPARERPAREPALGTREIEDALGRLPASRRDAWLLHHVAGFSFQEIAARLRIGTQAAKLRSSRAMKALRTMLGGGGSAV